MCCREAQPCTLQKGAGDRRTVAPRRAALALCGAAALAFSAAQGLAGPALAQAAQDPAPVNNDEVDEVNQVGESESIEEIVVTGTRSEARRAIDSTLPVDVISAETLGAAAGADMMEGLRSAAPAYNVATQVNSDAAALVRPANLRGLAPDHTLVLVNGKRRHRAAVITWLGSGVADGAQGPDISVLPLAALSRVELLQGGAAAQYGSDAIAGVLNFLLKEGPEGGAVEAFGGAFSEGDGERFALAGNVGIGSLDAWLRLSGEFGAAAETDRSVQRSDAARLAAAGNTHIKNPAQRWGAPELRDDIKLLVNGELNVGAAAQLYGYANYASRSVLTDFSWRNPNTHEVFSADGGGSLRVADLTPDESGVCTDIPVVDDAPDAAALGAVQSDPDCFTWQEVYPGGFTPRFGADTRDLALLVGVRASPAPALRLDISAYTAENRADFFIENTLNASLGPESPRAFDPGAYVQAETAFNLDFTYEFSEALHLAWGMEYREEEFETRRGEPASYAQGELFRQGFAVAAQGFPGFDAHSAGAWRRWNTGWYVDLEFSPRPSLFLDGALRYEHFEDFGDTFNVKLSGNTKLAPGLALRAGFATGFRAPTPGQSNAFNVTTELSVTESDVVLSNTGVIPAVHPVARRRGGKTLDAETSTHFSLGLILERGPARLSVDAFRVEVRDRLALSQDYTLDAEARAALAASGIAIAESLAEFRFFTNDFETRSTGIDVAARTRVESGLGETELSLSYHAIDTEVTRRNPDIIDDFRVRQLETNLPKSRGNFSLAHAFMHWRLLLSVRHFGSFYDRYDDYGAGGVDYGAELLTDVELRYAPGERWMLGVGVRNAFDNRPDRNPAAGDWGNPYSQYSPSGFDGRFGYLRSAFRF